MTQGTSGRIVNYRLGTKTRKSKECIIQFAYVKSVSEVARLIGRKVVWPNQKSKAVGKIVALHGKKGLVRARFRKGVPGQALSSLVDLTG